MTGSDWGIVVSGVVSITSAVLGFILAFQRKAETLSESERKELDHRRRWYRVVTRELHVPLRDWFARKGEAEPVDFDRWTRYPPEDDS